MNPTSRDVHIPSAMGQPKRVQKPWTVTSVPPSLKNFSDAEKARFVEVANSVLRETQDEAKAIQAGLHAVNLLRQTGKSWLAKNHTYKGAMVALFLPEKAAKQLALPDGLGPSELHVTLVYLGEANQIKDPTALMRQVERFASSHSPLRLKIGGVGQFNEENSEGKRPFYASVDSSDLPGFRQALVEALQVEPDTEHGFTPHVTLKYVPKGNSINTSLPELEFRIDTLSLCLGGVRWDYPLGGSSLAKIRHSKSTCMLCKNRPPTRDILWNGGKARAWLCDNCFGKWAGQNGDSIVRMAYIGGGVAPARHRKVRQSPRGAKKVNKDTILKVNGQPVTLGKMAHTYLIVMKQESEREKLKATQQARAKRYGIAARDDGALTIPARFERLGAKEADFADPVNYKFPVWLTESPDSISPEKLGMVRNAPARFGQFASNYDTKSRGVVQARIDQALKRFKVGEFRETEKGLVVKEWEATIVAKAQDKQLAYGLILRPNVPDAQGDIYNEEEVEKAAHWYAAHSLGKADWLHEEELPRGDAVLVESFVAPIAFDWNGFEVKRGDWLGTMWVRNKEKWEAVKKGEIQAFSIKGQGKRMALG